MSRADRKESESGYIFLRYVFPLILFLPFIVEVAMDTVSLFIGSVTCILFGTICYPESFVIVTSAVYGSRARSMFFSSFNYETIHLFEPASESNSILVGTYGLISFLYIVYVLFSVVEFLIGPRNLNLRRKYLHVLYISMFFIILDTLLFVFVTYAAVGDQIFMIFRGNLANESPSVKQLYLLLTTAVLIGMTFVSFSTPINVASSFLVVGHLLTPLFHYSWINVMIIGSALSYILVEKFIPTEEIEESHRKKKRQKKEIIPSEKPKEGAKKAEESTKKTLPSGRSLKPTPAKKTLVKLNVPLKVDYTSDKAFYNLDEDSQARIEAFLSTGNYKEAYEFISKKDRKVKNKSELIKYIPITYRERFIKWYSQHLIFNDRPEELFQMLAGLKMFDKILSSFAAYYTWKKMRHETKNIERIIDWLDELLRLYNRKQLIDEIISISNDNPVLTSNV